MKIKSINCWKQDLDLKRPYSIAYKTVDSVVAAFVEITLENGLTGIGSANPSQYVVGESVMDTVATLETGALDWLVGQDIRALNQHCEELMTRFPKNPGVRATADIALYDAFTKHLDVPLVTFLGQQIESMATSVTIGIKNVEETLEEADEFIGMGFKILKVKLGNNLEEDIERLVKLREKYASSIKIRIDANQGYSVAQLVDFFNRTANLDIELNEQPLKADQIDEMKNLPAEIKATIAADETLVSPEDAFMLASPPHASGIFNIKLMKCGGVHQGRKIARIAEISGTDLMWGCNDESVVSIAAALHTAFSSARTKYIDLDGSFDLAKDVVSGGFIVENGVMRPNGKPGLGVQRLD